MGGKRRFGEIKTSSVGRRADLRLGGRAIMPEVGRLRLVGRAIIPEVGRLRLERGLKSEKIKTRKKGIKIEKRLFNIGFTKEVIGYLRSDNLSFLLFVR